MAELRWKRFNTVVQTKTGGERHLSWQRVCVLARAEGYVMVRYDSSPFQEHGSSVPFVMTEEDWNELPVDKPERIV